MLILWAGALCLMGWRVLEGVCATRWGIAHVSKDFVGKLARASVMGVPRIRAVDMGSVGMMRSARVKTDGLGMRVQSRVLGLGGGWVCARGMGSAP